MSFSQAELQGPITRLGFSWEFHQKIYKTPIVSKKYCINKDKDFQYFDLVLFDD
jgi:hypothetical protein